MSDVMCTEAILSEAPENTGLICLVLKEAGAKPRIYALRGKMTDDIEANARIVSLLVTALCSTTAHIRDKRSDPVKTREDFCEELGDLHKEICALYEILDKSGIKMT